MFVPIIPVKPSNVKNIIYQDTVVNTKELGKNICVTEYENVSETEYAKCINKICEENKDAVFNKIVRKSPPSIRWGWIGHFFIVT